MECNLYYFIRHCTAPLNSHLCYFWVHYFSQKVFFNKKNYFQRQRNDKIRNFLNKIVNLVWVAKKKKRRNVDILQTCKLFCMKLTKELSLCHKLWFSNPNIYREHNQLQLRYFHLWILLGITYIGIKFKFVAKTQFLCSLTLEYLEKETFQNI